MNDLYVVCDCCEKEFDPGISPEKHLSEDVTEFRTRVVKLLEFHAAEAGWVHIRSKRHAYQDGLDFCPDCAESIKFTLDGRLKPK